MRSTPTRHGACSLACSRAVRRWSRARLEPVTRLKICGITRAEDGELAVEAGAWALGFILWPGSKRFVEPAMAAGIRARTPTMTFRGLERRSCGFNAVADAT